MKSDGHFGGQANSALSLSSDDIIPGIDAFGHRVGLCHPRGVTDVRLDFRRDPRAVAAEVRPVGRPQQLGQTCGVRDYRIDPKDVLVLARTQGNDPPPGRQHQELLAEGNGFQLSGTELFGKMFCHGLIVGSHSIAFLRSVSQDRLYFNEVAHHSLADGTTGRVRLGPVADEELRSRPVGTEAQPVIGHPQRALGAERFDSTMATEGDR